MTVASSGTSSSLVDEMRALGAQRLHHVPVVDDLLADIDGVRADFQRQLHDIDGAIDARAEASRPRENDFLHAHRGRHGRGHTHDAEYSRPAALGAILLNDLQ